jgi:hypothetical protein
VEGSQVLDVTAPHQRSPLKVRSDALLTSLDPSRFLTGTPQAWADAPPDSATGQAKIRIFPVPDAAYQIEYTYLRVLDNFDGLNTAASPASFVASAAIVYGAIQLALSSERVKNYAGASAAAAAFERAMQGMRVADCDRRAPLPLRLGSSVGVNADFDTDE